jgi:hypothetical protein
MYKVKIVYKRNGGKFDAQLQCIESDDGCPKDIFERSNGKWGCSWIAYIETELYNYMSDLEIEIKKLLETAKNKIKHYREDLIKIEILEF